MSAEFMSVESINAVPATSATPHAGDGSGGGLSEHQEVGAFATILAQEIVDERSQSTARGIAAKLPGSPENVEAFRKQNAEEAEIVEQRQAFTRQLLRQGDAMAFRD